MLFPTVCHSALPLPHTATSYAVHLEGVKGVLSGCRQGHGLTTPRMGTPSDVGVGVNKRLDVKVEKPLSHFTRHHVLNYILHVIHIHIKSGLNIIYANKSGTFEEEKFHESVKSKMFVRETFMDECSVIRCFAKNYAEMFECNCQIHGSFCLESFPLYSN